MRIDACLDSHVHWAATGEFATRLRLESLRSADDLTQLKPERTHFRDGWLLGFGWDDSSWPEPPTREALDRFEAKRPVAFARADGHGYWVNSEALKRAGLPADGGGVLLDRDADPIHRALPEPESMALRRNLLAAVKTFNDAGFTHIRDMTCDEAQWNAATKLDESGLLTLAVEEFFWLKNIDALEDVLNLTVRAQKSLTQNLRAKGIKVFLDGALGSGGACLSQAYCGSVNHGHMLWEKEEFKEILTSAWERGLEVAVHSIGDACLEQISVCLAELASEGRRGLTHIEHAELARPETLEQLRAHDVFFHLQPLHWLSDSPWLEAKVGDLKRFAFPWRKLQELDLGFHFGSDSPIVAPGVKRTFEALRASVDGGVPRLLGSPEAYMSHPDHGWAPNSFSLFENEEPVQVVFRGEHLM